MILALGIFCLLGAFAAFILYLRTSYQTEGGSLGQDPCIAAATIQIPLLTMAGLSAINKATGQFDFAGLQYVLIWFVETLCVAAAMLWIGRLASKRAKSTSKCPPTEPDKP